MFKVDLKKKILDANEQCAFENTKLLAEKKVFCLNMISSPGSGKTTILARTITDLKDRLKIAVIEGDVKTDIDTQKIKATGAPAVQINTHGACHLSAEQITAGLHNLPLDKLDVVIIENVGNLVCPTDFELGENAKLAVLSVVEGDDKPAKYPAIFSKARVLLINKMDLLKVVEFDLERVKADARRLNPDLKIFPISAKTGEGMQNWYDWLLSQVGQKIH
jgi:hydrogenase nickel incorporation protein HypB